METTRTRPGGRSARIRTQVTDAVIELLAQHGRAGVSHAEVARISGVSKTSIYNRWPTTADLILDSLTAYSEQLVLLRDTGNLRSDLINYLMELARGLRTAAGQALYKATLFTPDDPPEIQQVCGEFWRRRYQSMQLRFDHAVEAGELPPIDSMFLADLLSGSIYLRISRGATGPFTRRDAERLIDLVIQGLWVVSKS